MISGIITTVIISILLGTISPISSIGVNFPSQNLFSQIVSKLPKKSLSEVNPMESLSNVTAPLDNVFRAIKDQLGGSDSIKNFLGGDSTLSGRVKSSLVSSFNSGDASGTWQAIGMLKSVFILVTKIFLAVLQIAMTVLKAILGLVS